MAVLRDVVRFEGTASCNKPHGCGAVLDLAGLGRPADFHLEWTTKDRVPVAVVAFGFRCPKCGRYHDPYLKRIPQPHLSREQVWSR